MYHPATVWFASGSMLQKISILHTLQKYVEAFSVGHVYRAFKHSPNTILWSVKVAELTCGVIK